MTTERLTPQQARWVEQALPSVRTLARTLAPKMLHASLDELVSAGSEGLVDAALRYEPESGVPFGAFAHYRVRGAMIDAARRAAPALRRKARAIRTLRALQATQALLEHAAASQPAPHAPEPRSLRERVAAAADLVAQATTAVLISRAAPDDPELVLDEEVGDAEQRMLDRELRAGLQTIVETAEPAERQMVQALYFEGTSMQEYADRIGKSKSTVSRQHSRLLRALGERLRARLDGD